MSEGVIINIIIMLNLKYQLINKEFFKLKAHYALTNISYRLQIGENYATYYNYTFKTFI